MTRVLITGASGFIGSALSSVLSERGWSVRRAFRQRLVQPDADTVVVGELHSGTAWEAALEGVSAVVHLAGPAHARHGPAVMRRAIIDGTLALAEQAEAAGIGRFVFVSSIKASAARTNGRAVSEQDVPNPSDAYGGAKLAAEALVLPRGRLNPVVLRPPLVHGARAPANFGALLKLADTPLLLPLAGFTNERNLIAIDSLIGAICTVLDRSEGPAGVFHVADQPALSTTDIVAALRRGLGRPPSLFRLSGLSAIMPAALRQSLAVQDTAFRSAYGYGRAVSSIQALERTAADWKARR